MRSQLELDCTLCRSDNVISIGTLGVTDQVVMMPYLLILWKIRAPIAVLLGQVLVIPLGYSDLEPFKLGPHSVTVLFTGSIFQLPLPISVVAPNVGILCSILLDVIFQARNEL